MRDDLPICTVGHSTRTIAEFTQLLGVGGVELVVDVRTVPRSRRNPQYNEDILGSELAPIGIEYIRIAGLGGLRGRSRDVPPEVNAFWENQSFHNYADYALSGEFRSALEDLLQKASNRRCVIMCSESLWWRCHRRIIADYLLTRGTVVLHLMGADRIDRASLTSAARVDGTRIVYPKDPTLPDHPQGGDCTNDPE